MTSMQAINDPTVGAYPGLAIFTKINQLKRMQAAQFGSNVGAIFQMDDLMITFNVLAKLTPLGEHNRQDQ